MIEELKTWLNDVLKKYSNINEDLMNELLKSRMDHILYISIPAESSTYSHTEKVGFMMNLLNEKNSVKIKPKMNLVIADGSSSLEYVEYLSTEFDVNVVKINDIKDKSDIDLVLYTGGEDVDPSLYGEKKGRYTSINKSRDIKERECFNFFAYTGVPSLGICRGNQFLTVMNGGKLIQHVEGHGRDHAIKIRGKSMSLKMTSTHHQIAYPFNLEKDKYELIAYSEYFQSNTYLNGGNEEIELPREFLEPEIVFYPGTKCLGIQGHPEYSHCDIHAKKFCMNLIKKYLLGANTHEINNGNNWHNETVTKNSGSINTGGLHRMDSVPRFIPSKKTYEDLNNDGEILLSQLKEYSIYKEEDKLQDIKNVEKDNF